MTSPFLARLRCWALAAAGAACSLAFAAQPLTDPLEDTSGPLLGAPGASLPDAAGTLALDTGASTTDLSTNVPTAWWFYTGINATQVGNYLNANNARLTDIEVQSVSAGVPTFTVRMVRNSGAYAVPGWWWYYGLTAAQVSTYLNQNTARLIDLEPYDIGGGVIRYAVVMVSNTGAAARTWWWYYGQTSAQIANLLPGRRLIDLDSYGTGASKRYTAVMIANTGTDNEAWEWWLNQTPASISARVSAFNGRVIKLDRQADGTYNFIQVRNTGSEATAWWYWFGFTSPTALLNYANQLGVRPVDIVTYLNSLGQRRWDAAFIDNTNASTRRMRNLFGQTFLDANGNPTRGIFEAYLKQVGGAVKVDLNSRRRAETASSLKSLHLLHSMRRVQAGTDTLASAFNYYEYDPVRGKDACPDPSLETRANLRTNYNFETGLDEMMSISDNRTTRGAVIRYGGFAPFNSTATWAGLTGTTLRHNIGCAYRNLSNDKFEPATLRNDTTAADLARIYEGVWNSTLLTAQNAARTEFLESANPRTGASAGLQAIINQEAAALGKSAIAAQFGGLVRTWGKGGSYGTCLPNSTGACGQRVIIRSGTGLIRLPVKVSGATAYRTYSFGRLISDVPVTDWNAPIVTTYDNAFGNLSNELFRDEIRAALQTW
ncbi:MAG: serine hydrolase [Piscinibacter sp.]|uniref:serine hydrolase n=1 Tax=Piscinibacter TaxID=1114981 RepID=UPI000FDE73A0|nr:MULTISPECIES: serine hydrolase [Piscinibacter]MCW5666691.1 serine hydrolase [Piscinibacter sp.]